MRIIKIIIADNNKLKLIKSCNSLFKEKRGVTYLACIVTVLF
jgi:hypothetical protein